MTCNGSLGNLANPAHYTDPLAVDGVDTAFLSAALERMLVIRNVENVIGHWVIQGLAKTPCHLAIGQEAVPVGISRHLNASDRVFGAHRSHGHFLALNDDVYGLLSEVLGKADGASKGMGGSMHLYDAPSGFYGSVPIVGATIPLAVGAGFAAQMDGTSAIGVCYFGDGTTEEGVFHESLNFAANFKVPVLFVCENNLYSSHLDIAERQPATRVGRFADANMVPTRTIDGNNVVAVAAAAAELIGAIRNGEGPGFIEAVTYRWRGHVGPHVNIDVGVRRKEEDILAWQRRDPVERLFKGMEAKGLISRAAFDQLTASVLARINVDAERAIAAPYPPAGQLMEIVYANGGFGR